MIDPESSFQSETDFGAGPGATDCIIDGVETDCDSPLAFGPDFPLPFNPPGPPLVQRIFPGEPSVNIGIGSGNPITDIWQDALGLPTIPCGAQFGPWCDPSKLPNPWILDASPGGNCTPGAPGCYNIPQSAGVYGVAIDPLQIVGDAAGSALYWFHKDWCHSSQEWSKGEAKYAKYAGLGTLAAAARGKEGLAGWLGWSAGVAAASSTAEDLLQDVTLCWLD